MANNKIDPYEMELLDLWNEVGGQMVIQYHTATIKPDKGDLQHLRAEGFKTDVMTCIIFYLGANLGEGKVLPFLKEADAAGAAPSVTFEASEGQTLNITDKESNPMVDDMVQAVCEQE